MRPLVATVALLLALTGCTGAPDAPPTSSPAPTESAPTDPDLIVGTAGFRIVDQSGAVLAESSWFGDPAATVALTSETLGAEPTTRPYDGNIETTPGTDYVWDGFALRVLDDVAVDPQKPILSIVDDSIDGLFDVTLENGLRVGSTTDEVEAAGPDSTLGDPLAWFTFDSVELAPLDGTAFTASSQVQVDLAAGVVVLLVAPVITFAPAG